MAATYQYLRQDSTLHRMDPLSKGVWLVIVSVAAFVIGSPVFFVAQLAMIAIIGLTLGRVPVKTFARGVFVLLVLAIALFTFQVLFIHRGDVMFEFGPLRMYSSGIRQGLITSLRILLISVASLVYVWTTNPRDLIRGLIHVGLPYRIAYAMFVAFQIVPLLQQEATIIREAHLVRGLAEVGGRLEAWKRYFVPLLAYSIRKAEMAAIAMDSRAFGAFPTRSFIDEFRWSRSGLTFLAGYGVVEMGLVIAAAVTGSLIESYSAGML